MTAVRGLRVVVTREKARADGLAAALVSLGAIPVLFPTIETRPTASLPALDAALSSVAGYDWIVFTSAAGVRAAFARQAELGVSADWLADRAVAAVGPATAAALEERGVKGVAVPPDFVGDRIADAIGPVRCRRFLLLRANLASAALPDRLRSLGGVVDDVEAYRTVPLSSPVADGSAAGVRSGIDAVTFTSPSTVEGFVNGVGEDWREVVAGALVVTIGPVTSRAARSLGLRVDAEADPHTIDGLIGALVRAFEAREMERTV